MNESISLGRIAGVRVGINWSVLAIFALVSFSLAAGRLPAEYPDFSTGAYTVSGVVAGVIFFLSLLAHEVAHAVIARRNGLEVEGITLWLFGGVARLGGEAADPGADLRIAGVGPLVSLLLAGGFYVLELLIAASGVPELAIGVLSWLAMINLALAAFNLVPAAPLDGGRILRAALWRWRGDRLRATVNASRAGVAFGGLLVLVGLAEFAFNAGFGGLWFVLIGWFLINAARSEQQYAQMRGKLGDIRVEQVMSPDPLTVPAHLSVEAFIRDYLFRHRYATFPLVADGDEPAGLVSLNRIREVPTDERGMTSLRNVACPPDEVATVAPGDHLAEALPRMTSCADGRLVVVDDGRVVGIVSPSDVTHVLEYADLRDSRDAAHV